MKRMLTLLLAGLMMLSGCAPAESEQQSGRREYDFYYLESDISRTTGGALATESIQIEVADDAKTETIITAMVTELLHGPRDTTLTRLIPEDTELVDVRVTGGQAVVDLTVEYSTLSGVALTLADYAIALTLTQLPDIMSVKITVLGRDLAYREKQIFMAQDVLLEPEGDVVNTVPVELYFCNENGRLQREKRMLDVYEGETQVGAVARALQSGPEDKNLVVVLPEGFKTKSVWQEEDTCYVNLISALLPMDADQRQLELAVQAIAKSMCSLESVEEVQFLVDGEFATYYGPVEIEEPYTN